ncbi:type I glyceraldehyde-3-phosphate dehydrogenase [bacterium]|nr:type I glyceraldehyde-3-phosphate dehydrogenase [bacterium]
MSTIGINGFGRIGRTATRVWMSKGMPAPLGLINTSGSMDIDGWVHLLKYDSNYGPLHQEISYQKVQDAKAATPENPLIGYIIIGQTRVPVTAGRDPAKIPWAQYGVETVIESTGAFTAKDKAELHLQGGAKRVIITAPAKGDGVDMSVLSVKDYDPASTVVSNASCTTNCVGPIIKVLHEAFGIEKALLNTVHSYTDDQNLQDNSHKDLRRARSAAMNIVPTSTGAAKAVGTIYPPVAGKFDGVAIRVPTRTGSLSDIVFVASREVSIEQVNQALTAAAASEQYRGIIKVTRDPIVSSDIIGLNYSSIVDLTLTNVVGGNLVRVVAWYDNEWGYCNRLVEQAIKY